MNLNRIAHLSDALHILDVLEAMGQTEAPVEIDHLRWLTEQAIENNRVCCCGHKAADHPFSKGLGACNWCTPCLGQR